MSVSTRPPAPARAAGRATAKVRRLIADGQKRLEQERERRLVVALGYAIADRSRQTAASVLAGALAFRFFFTLLPLTLVLVVGLGYAKDAGGAPSDALKQFGIKGVLASTINQSASFSDPGRTAILVAGLVGVLSGARTTAKTIRAIHALAWGLPVARWRRQGRATIFLLGAVAIAFSAAGLATRARSAAGLAPGLGASLLGAGIVGGVWLGASWVLPHRDGVRWVDLVPGAAVVGVGFALLQALTADLFGPKLNHDSSLYGSMGVAFLVLGWLYVVGRLIVAAPLLNAALFAHRHPQAGPAP